MKSFMMQPAKSLDNVQSQLTHVRDQLQQFSLVENRILSAASAAMPRTTVFAVPQLFSGQIDIHQLVLDQFGIGFLQAPQNAGPKDKRLQVAFALAMETFLKPKSVITTKMVWSFADTFEVAEHYSNGIMLICDPPDVAWLWDTASYVVPLSNDPKKNEYIFPPGSSFDVLSTKQVGKNLHIQLKVHVPENAGSKGATATLPVPVPPSAPLARKHEGFDHVAQGTMNGRWCRCVEAAKGYVFCIF